MIRNAFILTATDFGPMIVNRLDFAAIKMNGGVLYVDGVGRELLETNAYRRPEIDECFRIIESRFYEFGKGVVVLDIGANIGTYALGWAHRMHEWGGILAIEAQERIFYALAGNIAINNCFNVQAIWAAVTEKSGSMIIPVLDPCEQANFGGLSLTGKVLDDMNYESIGEAKVQAIAIDDLRLQRLDFMKIDVQGMEPEVLKGAKETISRCRPIIIIERNFKSEDYCRIIPNYRCRIFGDQDFIMEPLF